MKPQPETTQASVRAICQALHDKKALDLRVLDVSERSSITDTLIVATGTSEPHLRALRIAADEALSARPGPVRLESSPESGWTVLDAFDVMVHLFTEEQRDRYRLEHLWKDATEINVEELLAPPPKAKKPVRKKKAAPKASSRRARKP